MAPKNTKDIPKDKDIRKKFIERNMEFFKQDNCIFVNEFMINRTNCCDLAFFDFNKGVFYGFEIKSAVDNFKRLEKQLITYTDYFNVVYVICAENHIVELEKFLNSKKYGVNIGIIKVDNNLNFTELKKATYYKSFYDTFIRNLDKEELILLCEEKDINSEGSKNNLIGRLKQKVSYEELFNSLRNKLRKYYVKKCNCGSKLYFNKVSCGIRRSYCYECDNEISE